ncbi:PREDICTED: uncharacterized protein LOC108757508 [Trachymyrmex cornetzi]|uniref:uncharacterized protein LOC108757508 n=1 Tax=Trachymyrmex cornetzi TaxID=471704 RepID=UPI00084EDE09|nr:PREDICTED: uncharacterized protein LOC108757508 [Trachymyrmex cornetzi]
MSNNEGPAVKCGYCGWLMFGSCAEIQAHQCFKNYDENIHVLSIDKTGRATIRIKDTNENMHIDVPPSESNECTISVDTKDEMLIDAVERRPALWNFKLPQKRTPVIKRLNCHLHLEEVSFFV